MDKNLEFENHFVLSATFIVPRSILLSFRAYQTIGLNLCFNAHYHGDCRNETNVIEPVCYGRSIFKSEFYGKEHKRHKQHDKSALIDKRRNTGSRVIGLQNQMIRENQKEQCGNETLHR